MGVLLQLWKQRTNALRACQEYFGILEALVGTHRYSCATARRRKVQIPLRLLERSSAVNFLASFVYFVIQTFHFFACCAYLHHLRSVFTTFAAFCSINPCHPR